MNVFDLFASLKLDTSEYEKGMSTSEKQAGEWGKSLEKAALAGVAAVGAVGTAAMALTQNVTTNGDAIKDNSQRVGMSYKSYQQWDYIMKTTGSSMAENAIGFKTLTNKIDDARNGTKSAQETFKRLGISMNDVKKLSREDMFKLTVQSLQNVKDDTEKAALANDLFGRSGMKLIPLLNTSNEELNQLFEDTEKYGMLMSDDMVESSDEYQDSLIKLKTMFGGIASRIVSEWLPTLIEWIGKVSDKINEFMSNEENAKLISDILGGSIRLLGKAFELVMKAIEKVVGWIRDFVQWLREGSPEAEAFKVIVIAIAGAFGALLIVYEVQKGIQLLTTAFNILAANPIVAVIGAIVAVLIYLWNTNEGFRNAVKAIWDAISGFFRAAWETIKGIWEGVSGFFSGIWEGIKGAFSNVGGWFKDRFSEGWERTKEGWQMAGSWFSERWNDIKNGFSNVGGWFKDKFSDGWERTKENWALAGNWFGQRWNDIKNGFNNVGGWFKEQFSDGWERTKENWALAGNWFGQRWGDIKGAFNESAPWFKQKFSEGWANTKMSWQIAGNWFSEIWGKIKNVFGSVGSWFKQKFSEGFNGVKNAFSGFGSFFSGLWNNIKNTFSGLGTKIGSAISGAVRGAINGVISAIERTINKAVGLINGAIGIINKLPGVNIGRVPSVRFPRLARGGVLEKGQVGLLEGSGAEAVVPLENNAKWINKVALDMTKALGKTGNFEQNITINSPEHLSPYEVARQTRLATQNMVLAIRS